MSPESERDKAESMWWHNMWPEDIPRPMYVKPEAFLLLAILVELRKMNARD